jgi:triosephosphate isomerase (TIM)
MKKLFLNWKENGNFNSLLSFKTKLKQNNSVVLFPPLPYLNFAHSHKLKIGSQNVSQFEKGAFTGEVSASMLKDCKVQYCLVGHSERRSIFKETEVELLLKIKLLQKYSITPILCIGENLTERNNKTFFEKIQKQMKIFQKNQNILIAYEPVWSIGTGITPSNQEIEEISNFIYKNYSIKTIYGGSVSSLNAKEILNLSYISGLLIGGASLNVNEINQILDDNFGN